MTGKERLKALIDEHFDGDAEAAADIVSDLLMAYADHVEETEPYATKSIDALRKGANGARHLDEALK